jgi:hypothetical protein
MKLELNITATTVTLILLVLWERFERSLRPFPFTNAFSANCSDAGRLQHAFDLVWKVVHIGDLVINDSPRVFTIK